MILWGYISLLIPDLVFKMSCPFKNITKGKTNIQFAYYFISRHLPQRNISISLVIVMIEYCVYSVVQHRNRFHCELKTQIGWKPVYQHRISVLPHRSKSGCINSYQQHNTFDNRCQLLPLGRLNKKDGLTRYGDSHVKDKTSQRPSYL